MAKGSLGFNGMPVYYDYQNMYDSQFRPFGMVARNTGLSLFFDRYLFQKLFSVYDFTIPEDWDPDYFRYTLFVMGYTVVFNTDRWGIINNHGALYGRNVYYRPTRAIVTNPALRGSSVNLTIGNDCQLIKLSPDYRGAYDVVSTFSDLMALVLESMGTNLFNTKLAYVFMSDNKAAAESFKAMMSEIGSGQPAVFPDKKLFGEDGEPKWLTFNQNLKQTFLGNDLASFMASVESMFLSFIGIENVNFEKRERLLDAEVNANNANTKAVARVWLDSMQKSMNKVNEMFDLNLTVKLNEDYQIREEAGDEGIAVNRSAL